MLHFKVWYIICWGYTSIVFTLAHPGNKHTDKSLIDDPEGASPKRAFESIGKKEFPETYRHRKLTSSDIRATKTSLSNLVKELREFLHPTHFDFERFDISAQMFSNHLSDLSDLICVGYLAGSDYDEELLDSLTFTEHMFETMLDAAMTIRFCEFHDNNAYSGIKFMATICVRLLTFYKPDGQPDGNRPNFVHELSYLETIYEMWVTMFMNQPQVSFGTQRTFDKYKTSVKNSLNALRSHENLNTKKPSRS